MQSPLVWGTLYIRFCHKCFAVALVAHLWLVDGTGAEEDVGWRRGRVPDTRTGKTIGGEMIQRTFCATGQPWAMFPTEDF